MEGLGGNVQGRATHELLPRAPRNGGELWQPGRCRVLPDLNGWLELLALFDAAQTNHHRDRILGRGRPQRGGALWTEHLSPAVAAFSHLDIALGLAVYDQALDRSPDDSSKWRPGENLAVGAVANRHAIGIDLRRERNRPTVTSAFDVHRNLGKLRELTNAESPNERVRRTTVARAA